MDSKLLKWIQTNITKYELNKTADNRGIIYVGSSEDIKLKKHLDRIKKQYKSRWTSTYEWSEIILEN